jgi:histidine triad (HIT) family protein
MVAESPGAIAFLDIAPLARAHTLVAPRAHSVDLLQTDPDDAVAAIQLVKAVARAVVLTLDAQGCSVWQTNGTAGCQTVPHTHFHVLPRFAGDRILIAPPGDVESRPNDEELLARVRELIDPEWQVAT